MRITISALAAAGIAALVSIISIPASAESVAKECGAEWKAAKAAGTTNGQTWSDFYKSCRAQRASAQPAATPAPAPVATPVVAATPAAGQSVAKQCGDDWKAAKASGTTNGQTWSQFYKACRAQKVGGGAATPAATPMATPASAPAATAAPSYAPPRPATATGAGGFTTDTQAKAHCRADTVVWLNTKSGIYHFAGRHDYGNTKQGQYMCEADAKAAGDRAAKNEKHP
jgi:hypothetical protein